MFMQRPSSLSRLAKLSASLLVGAALFVASGQGFAQDAAPAAPAAEAAAPAQVDPNAVVARVGDETITEADLAFAAEDMGQDLANVPPEERKAFLTTVLIDMKVMAIAAKADQMNQTDSFKRRLTYLEDRALRRAYFTEKVAATVTPEAVQAAYDEFTKTFTPQDEVHARHILVASKEEADAIKTELDGGASFEDIAKEKSIDPGSGANGGDLGFFGKGMMVPEFEAAALALEPGQVSEPVQSQFGWHIIKVEEKRKSAPPSLQQVGAQLQQQVLFKALDTEISRLKETTAVEIPDAALAEAVKKESDRVPTP